MENYVGKVINGDCIKVMSEMPESCVDLIVTSPPYGVGIAYDSFDDDLEFDQYKVFSANWLREAYRVLKDDGRIAINIPYDGIVDLEEDSPHRSKTTAWGSWMSPSAPYIYNPKECVILAYKKTHIKKVKGEPEWVGEVVDLEQEDGTIKKKTVYQEEHKKEFMDLVYGQWDYFADTKQMTKATFSLDIPMKAIKILTYRNDLILDPFAGSGTSLCAAEIGGRRWIGIELSENYSKVAKDRVQHFVDKNKQAKLDFKEGVN